MFFVLHWTALEIINFLALLELYVSADGAAYTSHI